MSASAAISQSSFTAIVHAADGVRFIAKARSSESLTEQVVQYILARCDTVLWPEVASEVRSLVADQQLQEAVDLYFEHVGERWDEEYLEVEGYLIDLGRRRSAASHCGPLR